MQEQPIDQASRSHRLKCICRVVASITGSFHKRDGQMKETKQRLFITPALGLGLFLVLPWLVFGKAPGKAQLNHRRRSSAWRLPAATRPAAAASPAPARRCSMPLTRHWQVTKSASLPAAYTGVQGHATPAGYPNPPASGIITQVVYINKSVTIRGGYNYRLQQTRPTPRPTQPRWMHRGKGAR